MALDQSGLPGAIGEDGKFDGGDTAAILGNIIALTKSTILLDRFYFMLPYCVLGRTAPRRHPDLTRWYGHDDRFSRDQLIPLICAGIRLKRHTAIDIIYNWHKERYFLTAWNTRKNGAIYANEKFPDLTGPEVWALWIRYKKPSWAKLVLWALDLETLVGSILWRWFIPSKNRVTRNHMLVCITGMRHMPSFTMRLAYRLNDWPDLLSRWRAHCIAVREHDTYTLFQEAIN